MDARELKNKKRKERDPLHQGVITERAALSAREYKLNLDARLGKTQARATILLLLCRILIYLCSLQSHSSQIQELIVYNSLTRSSSVLPLFTQVIGNTTANSQQAGYYCSVCDCVLKVRELFTPLFRP